MNIKNIGSNQTEVTINGMQILYSYSTPVAVYVSSICESSIPSGFYKTSKKHSKTTSKYINQWYSGEYEEKDQFWFDMLVQGI